MELVRRMLIVNPDDRASIGEVKDCVEALWLGKELPPRKTQGRRKKGGKDASPAAAEPRISSGVSLTDSGLIALSSFLCFYGPEVSRSVGRARARSSLCFYPPHEGV